MNSSDLDTDFFYWICEKSTGRLLSHKCVEYVCNHPAYPVHVYSLIDPKVCLSDNQSQLPLKFFFKDEAFNGLIKIKENGLLPEGTSIADYEIVNGIK